MSLAEENTCPSCNADLRGPEVEGKRYTQVIGVEYLMTHPNHYDGVSEWQCPFCGYREGRWTGRALQEGESEPRYGGR